MKICILTTNNNKYDDRIYYKLARSLSKIASVFIINPKVSSIESDRILIIGNDSEDSVKNSYWIYRNLIIINPDIIQITEPLLLPIAVKYKTKNKVKLIYENHHLHDLNSPIDLLAFSMLDNNKIGNYNNIKEY